MGWSLHFIANMYCAVCIPISSTAGFKITQKTELCDRFSMVYLVWWFHLNVIGIPNGHPVIIGQTTQTVPRSTSKGYEYCMIMDMYITICMMLSMYCDLVAIWSDIWWCIHRKVVLVWYQHGNRILIHGHTLCNCVLCCYLVG